MRKLLLLPLLAGVLLTSCNKDEINDLNARLNEAELVVAELEAANVLNEQRINQLQAELNAAELALENAILAGDQALETELRFAIANVNDNIALVRQAAEAGDQAALDAALAALSASESNLQAQIDANTLSIEDLNARLDALTATVANIDFVDTNELNVAIQNITRTLTRDIQQNSEVVNDLADVVAQLALVQEAIEALEAEDGFTRDVVTELNLRILNMEALLRSNDLDGINAAIADLQRVTGGLVDDVDALELGGWVNNSGTFTNSSFPNVSIVISVSIDRTTFTVVETITVTLADGSTRVFNDFQSAKGFAEGNG